MRRLRVLVALSVAWELLVLTAWAARADAPAAVREVARAGFTVADLDASVAFFTQVLDFEKISEEERAGDGLERLTGVFAARARVARLRLGSEELELSEYLAPAGLAFPADTRADDLWFQHVAIVVSDMEAAYARLRERRVRHASSGPQRLPDWNPAAGGIEAFYFRDPDGHFLELIHFPKGKGDPRWQDAQGRLFLGIDHTAIAVRDTDTSLAFYRDLLGLRVAGTSENYGSEQEHLNAVFGARLRITALRASTGPGIELLEYLSPSGGRPRPADARASDLLYWHTDLVVRDAQAAAQALARARADFDSPGAVQVPGIGTALGVADPDGHRLRFFQGDTR